MEPAGVGALLAQLERLKARLAEEGLFDPARKKPLPAMPTVIGVITSPTGAVIRDILHRIRDRWPCQVIVWPVVVQGEAAAVQVVKAIEGFNALTPGGPVPRPDVLIVARGGGSVEDLWPFNDEALARAVVAGDIPLISAVGHETDTTLIDFVSDRRAPTPTAAAEMATPVLAELKAALADQQRRLLQCGGRMIEERRSRLNATARGLPVPPTCWPWRPSGSTSSPAAWPPPCRATPRSTPRPLPAPPRGSRRPVGAAPPAQGPASGRVVAPFYPGGAARSSSARPRTPACPCSVKG